MTSPPLGRVPPFSPTTRYAAPSEARIFRNVRWSMARRKWIFRRDPKPDSEDSGDATQEYQLSPDDGDVAETEGYGGDTEERVRLAAEAAEERMVDEVLALEKDVENARQEADELRSELERVRELPEDRPPGDAGRLAKELRAREEELEQERLAKAELIERNDRRLKEIEAQALAAAERVSEAERRLLEETERLSADAEARIARKAEEARREIEEEAGQRAVESERRALAAEEQLEAIQADAAKRSSEMRAAAADWLRGRAEALRREGEARAREKIERERELRHSDAEDQIGEVTERAGAAQKTARDTAISDTHEWTAGALQEAPTEKKLSLSAASFEELRAVGLSVTQTQRVIEYREANDGFNSLDELDSVPGFERSLLVELKSRVVP
jgi:DNA uptake protein ComE-like DNA-binding protein